MSAAIGRTERGKATVDRLLPIRSDYDMRLWLRCWCLRYLRHRIVVTHFSNITRSVVVFWARFIGVYEHPSQWSNIAANLYNFS